MMLQAALNGRRSKAEHVAVPVTPDEIAEAAIAALVAGANEVHVHPRDESGAESLEPEVVARVLRAVRAKVPDLPVGLTTGWWAAPGGAARRDAIAAWTELPDFCSVNIVEEDSEAVVALLLSRGIGVEAGLWTADHARRFVGYQDAPRCLRALLEINEQGEVEALAQVQAILDVLGEAAIRLPVLLHGFDANLWSVFEDAVRRRFDARIGLEDGLNLPDGARARDNAEMIRAARTRIPSRG